MKQKAIYTLAFAAAIAAMFTNGTTMRASERTDDMIESSFRNTYVYTTYLKDDAVSAKSKDGVVTLTGTVSEESHKLLAQQTAESMYSVVSVDNQLVTNAEIAAENADTWIGRKIKLSLMFHRNTDASRTVVEVKDAVVTLKGEASSMAQKELTTEYARDIEGVKAVQNEMIVAATLVMEERTAGEKIDDASITAQVKMALLMHCSTSSIDTAVTTRDGEVLLTGIALNAAEKSLVTKLVNDIQGVTGVKNDMTVKEVVTQ